MAWNISNILVNEAIANKKAGSGSDLTSRVSALEETVGDESGGLVKGVDDLETTVSSLDPNIYSTTETKIGKWGASDLYRKVYNIASLGNNTTVTIDLDIDLSKVTVKDVHGIAQSTGYVLPLPFSGGGTNSVEVGIDRSQSKIYIITLKNLSDFSAEIYIEYTKNPAPEQNTRKGGKK